MKSDIPEVVTGGANILKVDGTMENPTIKDTLAGANFEVYRPATEEEIAAQDARIVTIKGVSIGVIPVEFFDNEELVGEKVTKVTSVAGEKIVIYGLAYGTYYIVETKAPAGYNLLTGPLEITIDADSHEEEEAVVVENNKGAQLPETGGIGTTIYTTTGMTLIAFAAVMIVLRKREMEF